MSVPGPIRSRSPLACSGAMYDGEPMMAPLRVALPSSADSTSIRLASPKSAILGVPSGARRMLPGLRSRWTIRFSWA